MNWLSVSPIAGIAPTTLNVSINPAGLSNGVYQTSITYQAATAAQLAAGPVYPNNVPSTTFTPPAGSINILFADKNLRQG